MSSTHCPNCSALVVRGAMWCTQCYTSLAAPEQPAYAGVGVTAPVGGAGSPYAPAVHPLDAPPPSAYARTPAAWPATQPDVLSTPERRTGLSGLVVALVALFAVGVVADGADLVSQALGDDSKQRIAAAFRRGSEVPFAAIGVSGSKTAAMTASPADKQQAAVYLQQVEPLIVRMNTAIGDFQAALDRWADGSMSDTELAVVAKAFADTASTVSSEMLRTATMPEFLAEDISNLTGAGLQYSVAVDALMQALDQRESSGLNFSRTAWNLGAAHANAAWDHGVDTLYSVAGRPPANRPNKKS